MSNRAELKQFFDNDKIKEELVDILSSIGDPEIEGSVLDYFFQWFQSYFEGQCDEKDFLEQIAKLDEKECEVKLMAFIKKQIASLTAAVKESKKSTTQNVKRYDQELHPQSIVDRIQPKTNNSEKPSSHSAENKNASLPATKKQVKIIQKDEAKIQKAVEAVNTNNEDDNLLKELENKKKQRCKYFPNCKNMDTCPYVHPTELCKFFPKCKYGAQCLNKHPDCKFGKSCTRMDCFYEHPFPKKQGMNPLLQMMMMSMPGAPKRKIIGGTRPPFKKPFNTEEEKAEDKGQSVQTNSEQQ